MDGIIASAGGALPFLSALALAFGVLMYILLDGADLGVGVLFAINCGPMDREIMADSILPVWNANETWIVLVASGMLALFPSAFSILMNAFYLPLIVMLLALAIRGVALEFRGRASDARMRLWDAAFCGGFITSAFMQGIVAGAFLRGFPITSNVYAGGWGSWLNAFALCCGVALVLGYATLGSAWLIYRTQHDLQQRARKQALLFGGATAAALIALACWTPWLDARYADRWFRWPGPLLIAILITLSAAVAGWFVWGVVRRKDNHPLPAALSFFVLFNFGASATAFPMILPPSFRIGDAAAPRSGEILVLASYAVAVPIILAYNTFSFRVFHGKVRAERDG
jgi:cytochrome bd ubiquinol oxidase subunit II